jgi:hypothetical protein
MVEVLGNLCLQTYVNDQKSLLSFLMLNRIVIAGLSGILENMIPVSLPDFHCIAISFNLIVIVLKVVQIC